MKNIISQLIDNFHERKLPELIIRNKKLPEIKGKADVVTGMRRSGKTWFCYQKMKEPGLHLLQKEAVRRVVNRKAIIQPQMNTNLHKDEEQRSAYLYWKIPKTMTDIHWKMSPNDMF